MQGPTYHPLQDLFHQEYRTFLRRILDGTSHMPAHHHRLLKTKLQFATCGATFMRGRERETGTVNTEQRFYRS